MGTINIEKQLHYAIKKIEKDIENKYRLTKWAFIPNLEKILEERSLSFVFQPIFSISKENCIFGYEALMRIPQPIDLLLLFHLAEETDVIWRLEEIAHSSIVNKIKESFSPLFLNIHPLTLGVSYMKKEIFDLPNLYWELPQEALEKYPAIIERIKNLGRKIKLSFDKIRGIPSIDVLRLYDKLKPNFLKLDISLVSGAHKSSFARKTIKSIQDISEELGSKVIAVGIEKEEELLTIKELGIELAQGFLLSSPIPNSFMG